MSTTLEKDRGLRLALNKDLSEKAWRHVESIQSHLASLNRIVEKWKKDNAALAPSLTEVIEKGHRSSAQAWRNGQRPVQSMII